MLNQNTSYTRTKGLLDRLSKSKATYSILGLLGICASGLTPFSAAQAQVYLAQVNQADHACYLQSPDGVEYDLSALCGGFQQAQSRPQEVVLQTGDVQVTLRWDSADDLDLFVKDPSGEQVSFFTPSIASGGQLDVDANAGCAERIAAPVENIFWPTGEGVPGDYVVTVALFSRCENSAGPINFTLSTLVRGDVQTMTGTVSDEQASVDFPFTYAE